MVGEALTFNQMVEDAVTIDTVFQALSNGTRRAMLGRLAVRELSISELAEPLAMSFEAASKHIRVLERAGLVHRTIDGRRHVCRLEPAPLASAASWLHFYEQFWTDRFDNLEAMFKASTSPPTSPSRSRRKK